MNKKNKKKNFQKQPSAQEPPQDSSITSDSASKEDQGDLTVFYDANQVSALDVSTIQKIEIKQNSHSPHAQKEVPHEEATVSLRDYDDSNGQDYVFTTDDDDNIDSRETTGLPTQADVESDVLPSSLFHHPVPLDAPSALISNMVLGNQYRLISHAGEGKMGEVWKAFDIIGERIVALKFIPRNMEGYEQAALKAKSAFHAIHDLNHQYICPTHSLLEDANFGYFLVMKWIPDTLKQFIKSKNPDGKQTPLKENFLKPLLSNLADALDYIHSQNVIHRDIKPANIAIALKKDGSFDSASLIDFGLAVSLDHQNPGDDFFQMSGTPGYMSPEQWRNETQNAKSDQYALAVTAYELFAGHRVFAANNIKELRSLVLKTSPQTIPGIPAHINEALLKALSKNPKNRFPSCRAFVDAIYPPKRVNSDLKKFIACSIILFGVVIALFIKQSYFNKNVMNRPEKLQLYDFVLKTKPDEHLEFSLDKDCQVKPTLTEETPSPQLSKKTVIVDSKMFDPEQAQDYKTWSWTWSPETESGILTLKNYKGGPISIGGISVKLVLPADSINSVETSKNDALFVEGDLVIQAEPRACLFLSAGLWCHGKFKFDDNSTPIDFSQDVVTKVVSKDQPSLTVKGKKIDYFVDSAEKLNYALKQSEKIKTILITKSFESLPTKDEIHSIPAGFLIPSGQIINFLSSGNHIIKKSQATSAKYPLLVVQGTLNLGLPEGMGSSTLVFDGGSVIEDRRSDNLLKVRSMNLQCSTMDGKKQYRFYAHNLIHSSRTALVAILGELSIHKGVTLQNNINVNYFTKLDTYVSSNENFIGGVHIGKIGKLIMTGGAIKKCQGPLCGGVGACGEFIMSGGQIEGNCAYNNANNLVEAAGLRVHNTTFKMTGGEIINNFALANAKNINADICAKGGGIHAGHGSILTISGGKIRGNISLWAGGGIYMGGSGVSQLTISKDTDISENAAVLGGGIYTSSNINMSDGKISNNYLLARISAMYPRGEGVYIKEWNTPATQSRGPVLSLSKNALIDPNNSIFICSNIATGPLAGPCVFIPIRVKEQLTNSKQKFLVNMGTAAATNDGSIRIIQFTGKDFEQKKENLTSQFSKFKFGYLGFADNTDFIFEVFPMPAKEVNLKIPLSERTIYYLNLKEDQKKKKENRKN